MTKKTLWMFMAELDNPLIYLAIPTVAWISKEAGVEFECYLEAKRDGRLFAETGSTVIGGHHHQQFNYLNSVFDVKYIIFGKPTIFMSTLTVFGSTVMVNTCFLSDLYAALVKQTPQGSVGEIMFAPCGEIKDNSGSIKVGPYIYPEIYNRKALAFSASDITCSEAYEKAFGISKKSFIFLSDEERKLIDKESSCWSNIDSINGDDTYASVTLRIAERWKHQARGVSFGDPAAIASMLPSLCREGRIALYGERKKLPLSQIKVAVYTEEMSVIAKEVGELTQEVGNNIITGRQTCDGDLFEWSKYGTCMKIMDPNRPAFPVVTTIKHKWVHVNGSIYDDEPDDEMLVRYAKQGKILATVMFHSGEMAHNEAMINLFDLVCATGVKMGLGVHASRYETCPQLWELLNIPREKGGVRSMVEPVLHSGGMGVLAEANCPPDSLASHCKNALGIIRSIAGDGSLPRGYLAFMDSDLETLEPGKPEIYDAIASGGLDYVISSAVPGRNRILYETDTYTVFNQSCRTIVNSSPFIRITTVEDIPRSDSKFKPAWVIGTLDAPVIAFNPYIWRYGSRFMKIVDWLLKEPDVINVTPHVVSRYARILKSEGFLP